MPSRLLSTVRRLVRAAGFDVVRYNELPMDLDAGIRETIAAVKPFTLTSVSRVAALCEAVRYLADAGVMGAVVECGVWRGGSMMAVARTLLQCGDTSRHLHLFDTFQGMTAPTGKDVTFLGDSASRLLEVEAPANPESVWCIASLEEVRRNMQSTGYPSSCTHYIEGRVEDTIPAQIPDSIAMLRLDTDWYESTRHELEHLYPRLVKGGVLILDDYGHWRGARQAVDEYFARGGGRPLLHRIDYSGRLAIKVG